MPFHHSGQLKYFTFERLSQAGVTHAIFTRRGGVSTARWKSLNFGRRVGDHPERVAENHRRAFRALGRSPESMAEVRQVHGASVACFDQPPHPAAGHPAADALLTDRAHITLLMRFADCVPILLFDPHKQVVGLAHAGWRGTIKGVAAAAVRQMQARYDCRPQHILAAIGPSICPQHYEVGEDVAAQARQAFGNHTPCLIIENGRTKFDLWQANEWVLRQVGVRNVEVARICTACHLEDWFSHRAEQGSTGRFGALIGLENGTSARRG